MDEVDKQTDPVFAQQVQKLHRLTVISRWLVVCLLWLTIGSWCLWNLREEMAIWRQYFTWTSVRYSLYFHPFAAFGLAFCIGMTVAVLVWQSRNILWGIPKTDLEHLEKLVCKIRQQGASHPLWKWVCQ
ncbi:hypothetical protein [Calothrix sp. 336/3]|uniref:hypothetical protein n=1 Tax=Calothrix sp. 336/3 TaxID=1337936 RepID=UPI0004E4468A|nr:hypothetical protein [Calothrix sp. 336/3]AKG23528.1 hypothetical protein IJ00_21610 [Calothrix sp. 336/3]